MQQKKMQDRSAVQTFVLRQVSSSDLCSRSLEQNRCHNLKKKHKILAEKKNTDPWRANHLGPFGGASAPAPARATSASELELQPNGRDSGAASATVIVELEPFFCRAWRSHKNWLRLRLRTKSPPPSQTGSWMIWNTI